MSDKTEVLAISIQQPWAELIISGRKTIELRTWKRTYRGQLWLHTGLHESPELDKAFSFSTLFRGGYIGVVTLELIVEMTEERWEKWRQQHLDFGQFFPGFYAWVLSSPLRFKSPLLAPGKTGLYSPSQEIYSQLMDRLKDAEEG